MNDYENDLKVKKEDDDHYQNTDAAKDLAELANDSKMYTITDTKILGFIEAKRLNFSQNGVTW